MILLFEFFEYTYSKLEVEYSFLMPILNFKSTNRRRYRRFLRLFHREKPSSPAITHSYQYLIHFRKFKSLLNSFSIIL
jgi:hypothetical protein